MRGFSSWFLVPLISFACLVSLAWTATVAWAVPSSYSISTSRGSGTVVVDPDLAVLTDPATQRSEGKVLDFSFTSDFEPFFDPLAPDLTATIAYADFDSPADVPDAVFFEGTFAGLDIGVGTATLSGLTANVTFTNFFTDAASIDPTNAGELNINVSDGVEIWEDCCSYSFAPTQAPPEPPIPEPGAALLFGTGLGVVGLRWERCRGRGQSRRISRTT